MSRTPRLTRALVNKLPEAIEDPGPITGEEVEESYYPETAHRVLDCLRPEEPLWVFAIGSLIWNPRFEDVERRPALVRGWRRSFCLGPDTRYRGNPDQPGRMLSMIEDPAGECPGVVIRMRCDHRLDALESLLRKEPPKPPSWVTAETSRGPVQAIAFTISRDAPEFWPEPSEDAVAEVLASAVGMMGSMADYLLNTVTELERAGVHDPYIWRLQDLVARRLEQAATQVLPDPSMAKEQDTAPPMSKTGR